MIAFDEPSEAYGFLSPEDSGSFTVGKTLFTSVTQYIEYSKAMLFGDRETAARILREHDPYMQRGLGAGIEGFDEFRWNGQLGAVLYRGLAAKFAQRPNLVRDLVGTGDKLLAYCSPSDCVLGTGLWRGAPEAGDSSRWKGRNLLGFTLMELRNAWQEEMPEAAMPGREGADGMAHDADWGFPPCSGKEPYVYLSYAWIDRAEAARLARLIRDIGYPVWYDRQLGTGRIWSGARSRAVEGSMAVVELYTGEERVSHVECLAREFGRLLGIPHILVDTEDPDYPDREGDLHGSLTGGDSESKLRAGLESALAAAAEKAGDRGGKGSFDLVIRYDRNWRAGHGMFRSNGDFKCNLRTREKFDIRGRRVMKEPERDYVSGRLTELPPEGAYASDEEVYRAVVWLGQGFELAPVSGERDYIGLPEDWVFARRLAGLETGLDPEISREYDQEHRRAEEARANYPYMDEFEYINSLFDDE